jgi:hypothetical protein
VRQFNDFFNLGAEHPYFFEATTALHQAITEASLAGDWGTGYEIVSDVMRRFEAHNARKRVVYELNRLFPEDSRDDLGRPWEAILDA